MAPRRHLTAALVAVLAMSACASDETTGSTSPTSATIGPTLASRPATTSVATTASTTLPAATLPATTAMPATSAPPSSNAATTTTTLDESVTETTRPAASTLEIELSDSSLGGYTLLSPAAMLLDEFTSALGPPTVDSEWQPMPPQLICTGATEYRNLAWGNLHVVLERSGAEATPAVGSWVLGQGSVIAPVRIDDRPAEPVGITTTEGVGIGSSPSEITSTELTPIGDGFVVIDAAPVIIDVNDDQITGFAVGRLDCLDPALSRIPCDAPIPIPLLPDGTAPAPAVFDDEQVLWAAPPDGPNAPTVTQRFDPPSADEVANAAASPIGARIDPLDVRAVPVGDPPGGESTFYVFDDRSECVRVLHVGAGLDVDELGNYALFLADRLTPRR